MRIGPFTIARTKAVPLRPLSPSSGGWWPVIRESFTGAWQANVEIRNETALAFFAVYACVKLIATDASKLCLRLVEQDRNGIWTDAESPAFSPVLRVPNHYQTIAQFVEWWMVSKLVTGNTYVLKRRDGRGIVDALYVLDPMRVTPLVTPTGDVYYQLKRDDMSGLSVETITVPANAIIHDRMVPLFHPLMGVSPLYAAGRAAAQGLGIQANSTNVFTNASRPGGVVLVPGAIDDTTAARLKEQFETNYGGANFGRVAVLADGMTYEPDKGVINAVDAQLIEQLKWSAENVCSCYGVPAYMIGVGPPPPYANVEPLLQQYHAQCLQGLLNHFEKCLEQGLGIVERLDDGTQYGTEFDVDDLIWMDTATKTKAALDSITSGGMSPNEARFKYYGLGPVTGGDTPYLQQQMWPLPQLASRPTPSAAPLPMAAPAPVSDEDDEDDDMQEAASFGSLLLKGITAHA